MNICSLVVHTKPQLGPQVSQRLERLDGVEVHGGQDVGKLIVTVEDTGEDASQVADTMHAMNDIEGVVNTVLIYHYGADDLQEETTREIN